jgi:hypothetical protein
MAPELLRVHGRRQAVRAAFAGHCEAGAAGEELEDAEALFEAQYDNSVDIYSFGTLWLDMR